MIALFDHYIFAMQRVGGVSRYFVELLKRLGTNGVDADVFFGCYLCEYVDAPLRASLHASRGIPRWPQRGTTRLAKPVNEFFFSRFAARRKDALYHSTSYADFAPDRRGPRVVTVHDLTGQRCNAESVDPCWRVSTAVNGRVDGYICISENTRRDLIELYGVPHERTTVIHHGSNLRAEPAERSPLNEPYLLHVGGRAGYKNFSTTLRAYASSPTLQRRFALMCFGPPASPAELAEIDAAGLTGRVHFRGGDDRALATAYRHARAFVYPSKYEGFGLPLLEAMQYDCPVICSDTSCFPEIAADAAVYFDPAKPDALVAAIESVVDDGPRREALIAAGRLRHVEFTWDKTARLTADYYRRIAGA
jgi:glycosyltransferase involved in cell wall biosynthesis